MEVLNLNQRLFPVPFSLNQKRRRLFFALSLLFVIFHRELADLPLAHLLRIAADDRLHRRCQPKRLVPRKRTAKNIAHRVPKTVDE